MSAVEPLVDVIERKPLQRPAFDISARAMYDRYAFTAVNLEALRAWYITLRNESRGSSEEMPAFTEFCAVQYDIEKSWVDKWKEESRELRERHVPENERYANEVGVKPYGEL